MAAALTHLPVQLSVEWRSKTVTTDPPRYTPHTERGFALTLAGSAPMQVAVFLRHGQDMAWGLRPGSAATEVELRADFFPYDWARSDDVQVNFGWQRIEVTDPALKSDPRERVLVLAPPAVETGEIFAVAEIPAHGIVLEALAIVEVDTERRRQDRWRIKPEFSTSLPAQLVPLTSGSQSGVSRT
jgi:hypothetical protein